MSSLYQKHVHDEILKYSTAHVEEVPSLQNLLFEAELSSSSTSHPLDTCFDGRKVVRCTTLGSVEGGLSCAINRLLVTLDDHSKMTVILKTGDGPSKALQKQLKLYREAQFFGSDLFQRLKTALDKAGFPNALPKIYLSGFNESTGEKGIVMEDLSPPPTNTGEETLPGCIQAGWLFGPGSPLNWKHIDEIQRIASHATSARDIVQMTWELCAIWHSIFWKDETLLLNSHWLKGISIIKSEFETTANMLTQVWATHYEPFLHTDKYRLTERLVNIIRASLRQLSFERAQEMLQNRQHYTLTHGDWHPGNTLYRLTNQELIIVDFECVGVGSGPQELAQFLISHMDILERRTCEINLLQRYYKTLIENSDSHVPKTYSFEQCLAEYVSGGTERWIFYVVMSPTWGSSVEQIQYWIDQLSAFVDDHKVTEHTVGMPRL